MPRGHLVWISLVCLLFFPLPLFPLFSFLSFLLSGFPFFLLNQCTCTCTSLPPNEEEEVHSCPGGIWSVYHLYVFSFLFPLFFSSFLFLIFIIHLFLFFSSSSVLQSLLTMRKRFTHPDLPLLFLNLPYSSYSPPCLYSVTYKFSLFLSFP